jgi:hypothetical protein
MTVRITSRPSAENVEDILSYPDDVHIPGQSHSLYTELKDLGADGVFYDPRDHAQHFVLRVDGDLRYACKVVANYLRWLRDFGGGVKFTYTCPHCRHEEAFVL